MGERDEALANEKRLSAPVPHAPWQGTGLRAYYYWGKMPERASDEECHARERIKRMSMLERGGACWTRRVGGRCHLIRCLAPFKQKRKRRTMNSNSPLEDVMYWLLLLNTRKKATDACLTWVNVPYWQARHWAAERVQGSLTCIRPEKSARHTRRDIMSRICFWHCSKLCRASNVSW